MWQCVLILLVTWAPHAGMLCMLCMLYESNYLVRIGRFRMKYANLIDQYNDLAKARATGLD